MTLKHTLGLFLVGFALVSCSGYSPLYKSTQGLVQNVSVGKVEMQNITMNVGQRRVAQIVRQKLLQFFPAQNETTGEVATTTDEETYVIHVVVEETTSSVAVRRDATETRLRLFLATFLTLKNSKGEEVYKRNFTVSSAYNVEDSPFGTDTGRDYARQTAGTMLVEEVVDNVNLFLHQKAQDQAENPAPDVQDTQENQENK